MPPSNFSIILLYKNRVVPESFDILSIRVQKRINDIPWAVIVFAEEQDPMLQAAKIAAFFSKGGKIEIQIKVNSIKTTLLKGNIDNIRVRIDGNLLKVDLEIFHDAAKMNLSRESRFYHNVKDSEIFQSIPSGYGFSSEFPSTVIQHEQLVQFECTDWDFLLKRAVLNGLCCNIENDTIAMINPAANGTASLRLQYGKDLIEFESSAKISPGYNRAEAFSWNYSIQDVESVEIPVDANPAINVSSGIEEGGTLRLWNHGKMDKEELKTTTISAINFGRLATRKAKIKIVGNTSLSCGKWIEVRGPFSTLGGLFFISGVEHVIEEGSWFTIAESGIELDESNTSVQEQLFQTKNAAGLYTGIVTQLENDPGGDFRIRVKMPMMGITDEGVWCRISIPGAGKNSGLFILPEIGDEVIVGCTAGDLQYPVVLGSLHCRMNPAPLTATDDNAIKGYISRNGLKLLFNDQEKNILFETPSGKYIELSDENNIISISDQNGNQVIMDASGIILKSKGNISMSADKGILIEGNQMKLNGSNAVSLSSTGITKITGAVVNIN